jgi:hypothetical protein
MSSIDVISLLMGLQNDFVENIDEELVNPTDYRIFAISSAFYRGYSIEKVWQMTCIDKWFLTKLYRIFQMEQRLMCVANINERRDRSRLTLLCIAGRVLCLL